ncbi:Prefoldin [Syncephalis fuscata]|nr:Prefoldin [Syncephalis fuscata]
MASSSSSGGSAVQLQDLDLQQLQSVKQQLEDELSHFNGSFVSLKRVQSTFLDCADAIKSIVPENEGRTILVPLTASMYVPAELTNIDKVIVDVGTGYYVEKSSEDATKFYKSKTDFLRSNLDKLEETITTKQNNLRAVVSIMQTKLTAQQQQQLQKDAKAAAS